MWRKAELVDVMSELRPIGAIFNEGDFHTGLERLHDLWARIPEPKTQTLNAYLVLEYGVAFALKAGDLDEAQRWAALAPDFAKVRQDMGEAEFLVGKVAFERGEYEAARESFFVANAKSEGRAFEGEDEKYRRLIA